MHLLRCTGGRVSEVLSLKRMQVQDGQLEEVQIVGKGGKARTLFLDPLPYQPSSNIAMNVKTILRH
jgi:site-specific recombinase XerD